MSIFDLEARKNGRSLVFIILFFLLLGFLISVIKHGISSNTSELSEAEVNVVFDNTGDSITALAKISIAAPTIDTEAEEPSIKMPHISAWMPDWNGWSLDWKPKAPVVEIPKLDVPSIKLPEVVR